MIYVYEDYVFNKGMLLRRLDRDVGPNGYCLVDSQDILNGILAETPPFLLIMPGGADLYFCEKLNGEGNRLIGEFVALGGQYLGICAGAYYGCESLDWNNGEIAGPRELAFLPCRATGPVFEWLEDKDITKSWDNAVKLEWGNGDMSTVLYAGGPVFEVPEGAETEILARYTALPGKPPAIIAGSYGKGRVVLSSPHIEADADIYARSRVRHRNPSFDWQEKVQAALEPDMAAQSALWHHIQSCLMAPDSRHAA